MADRIIKGDSGNDVIIQNNDASRKIEVTNSGDVEVTGDVKTTTVKSTNLKTLENSDQKTKDQFQITKDFIELYEKNKDKKVVINLQTNSVEKDFERRILQLAFGPGSGLSSDIFLLNEYMTDFGQEGASALKYPKSVGNMTFNQYLAETQKISDSRLEFTDAVKNAVKMEYNRLKNK